MRYDGCAPRSACRSPPRHRWARPSAAAGDASRALRRRPPATLAGPAGPRNGPAAAAYHGAQARRR
jgi:hypothetical protein